MSVLTTTEKAQYDEIYAWYNNIKDTPIANNHIINGDFSVNQYADIDTAPVAVANDTYQIDRKISSILNIGGTIQRFAEQAVNGRYVNTVKYIASSTNSNALLGNYEKIENFYKGETKIFGAWVKSNNSNARVVIWDGVTYSVSSPHSGGGTWEFLTVTKTISVSATALYVFCRIVSSGGGTAVPITAGNYIESTMWQLESGTVSTDFEQLLPDKILSSCRWYYRIFTFNDGGGVSNRYSNAAQINMDSSSNTINMRTSPTFEELVAPTLTNVTSYSPVLTKESVTIRASVTAGGLYRVSGGSYALKAEL